MAWKGGAHPPGTHSSGNEYSLLPLKDKNLVTCAFRYSALLYLPPADFCACLTKRGQHSHCLQHLHAAILPPSISLTLPFSKGSSQWHTEDHQPLKGGAQECLLTKTTPTFPYCELMTWYFGYDEPRGNIKKCRMHHSTSRAKDFTFCGSGRQQNLAHTDPALATAL